MEREQLLLKEYEYHKDRKIKLHPDGDKLNQNNVNELSKFLDSKHFHLRGVKKWLRIFPCLILISWFEYAIYRWHYENKNRITSSDFYNLLIAILFAITPFLIVFISNIIISRIQNNKNSGTTVSDTL
jgi:hypothetical protein